MNTLENKAKFFAQYWGQEIFKYFESTKIQTYFKLSLSNMGSIHNGYLELKPLSSITDEELIQIYDGDDRKTYKTSISSIKGILINLKNFESSKWDYLSLNAWDFLRSKGYALPWMGLSVEEMINFGWIKLKANKS